MDCFDTILDYTNMQTIFFTKLQIQFFQNIISEIHENIKYCSFYNFYMLLCLSTNDSPHKVWSLVSSVYWQSFVIFETGNRAIKYMIYM